MTKMQVLSNLLINLLLKSLALRLEKLKKQQKKQQKNLKKASFNKKMLKFVKLESWKQAHGQLKFCSNLLSNLWEFLAPGSRRTYIKKNVQKLEKNYTFCQKF